MVIPNNLGTTFIKLYVVKIRTEEKCGFIEFYGFNLCN
jgi:hypothetical protein